MTFQWRIRPQKAPERKTSFILNFWVWFLWGRCFVSSWKTYEILCGKKKKKGFCPQPDLNLFQHHLERMLNLVPLIDHFCDRIAQLFTYYFLEFPTQWRLDGVSHVLWRWMSWRKSVTCGNRCLSSVPGHSAPSSRRCYEQIKMCKHSQWTTFGSILHTNLDFRLPWKVGPHF